jgi:hypothetical protein
MKTYNLLRNLLDFKVLLGQRFIGIKIAEILNDSIYQNPNKAKFK